MRTLFILAVGVIGLAACNDANDAAEDKMEQQAEASAAASGPAVIAFDMTEAQLLDAELVTADGAEIADVAQVVRAPDGSVERLLVEIEDSNPDRFVHVPLDGLTPLLRGNDQDLSTSMSKADLMALPAVQLQP